MIASARTDVSPSHAVSRRSSPALEIRAIVYLGLMVLGWLRRVLGAYEQSGTVDDLELAIERHDASTVRQLLNAGIDPNTPIADLGVSLMSLAIGLEDEHVIRVMAEFGGDVEQLDGDGCSALGRAASGGDQNSLLGALIWLGAEVDMGDRNGWTPLHRAAAYGYQENVRALLEAGADRSRLTEAGHTAEDLARQNNHSIDWTSSE